MAYKSIGWWLGSCWWLLDTLRENDNGGGGCASGGHNNGRIQTYTRGTEEKASCCKEEAMVLKWV